MNTSETPTPEAPSAPDSVVNPEIIVQSLPGLEAAQETLDPVQAISDLLTSHGHSNPKAWEEFLSPRSDATNPNVPHRARRYLVNRAWQVILGQMPDKAASARARYCLIDGDEQVWLKLFTESVLPLALELQLPLPWPPVPQSV